MKCQGCSFPADGAAMAALRSSVTSASGTTLDVYWRTLRLLKIASKVSIMPLPLPRLWSAAFPPQRGRSHLSLFPVPLHHLPHRRLQITVLRLPAEERLRLSHVEMHVPRQERDIGVQIEVEADDPGEEVGKGRGKAEQDRRERDEPHLPALRLSDG